MLRCIFPALFVLACVCRLGKAKDAILRSPRSPIMAIADTPILRSCQRDSSAQRVFFPVIHAICRKDLSSCHSITLSCVSKLRGGVASSADIDKFVSDAYTWCMGMGSPAALVAGAVIGTLYENIKSGNLEIHRGDRTWVRWAKKTTTLLLLSAFAMEVAAIFVTTVTGTMLLARDFSEMTSNACSGLNFMREHFEFEYLTSRICFLQGLVNWIGAVGVEYVIPRKGQGSAARRMNQFLATSLGTFVVFLLSFYNRQLTFYDNYFRMILRWVCVTSLRFRSFRPLSLLYVPGIMMSVYFGVLAFQEDSVSKERDD